MTSVQVSIRQENEPWEHPKKGPSQVMSQRRVSTSVTMCHGEILLPCERLISVLDMPCFCNKKLDFKCLCYILPSSHQFPFVHHHSMWYELIYAPVHWRKSARYLFPQEKAQRIINKRRCCGIKVCNVIDAPISLVRCYILVTLLIGCRDWIRGGNPTWV